MAMPISQEKWVSALDHTQNMMSEASKLPNRTGYFYVAACKQLIKRFLDGERTKALYKEMTELH